MEIAAEVLVVGGGLGGVAAALAALEHGRSVVLTEESPWLGGQLTTQAVPPDEHRWIERQGGSATYRSFRSAVRHFYRRWYPLSEDAKRRRHLNPGSSWVSPLAHEPRVALAVIDSMLLPHISAGRLRVFLETRVVAADVDDDRVGTVSFVRDRGGSSLVMHPSIVIDATETGELLALSGTEHVTGKESRDVTGEPHAAAAAAPLDMQAFTVCLALDYVPEAHGVVDRPDGYDRWQDATLPSWPGPQLSWVALDPRTLEAITYPFEPRSADRDDDRSHHVGHAPHGKDLWTYRRIVAKRNFQPGAYQGDISILNWPQNDYVGGPLFGVSPPEVDDHLEQARELTRSLLFWLQTEAPRADGGHGWPGLRPRGDIVGTEDGLAMRPYIRESRRILAEHTVREQEVSLAVRGGHGAERHADSVGTGYYRIDLHPTTGGSTYLDIPTAPFELPLGSLIPVRVDNLLPGAKDIGTTHVTNGCYRLHPVEWLVGEVAGHLAAFGIDEGVPPRAVRSDPRRLERFQSLLEHQGVALHWPESIRRWVSPP